MRLVHPVGKTRADRVRALASANFWIDFYGLIRRETLATTRLAQPTWGFDVVLLLEVCLRGEVALVPEPLFSYRLFLDKTQGDLASGLAGSGAAAPAAISWSNLALEMAQSIAMAPIGRREKARLTATLLWSFCLRNHTVRGYLRRDVARSARQALSGHHYRRALALIGLAGAIYPIQHEFGRAVFQRVRSLRRSS
jgi:hypothetical protein